MKTSLLQLPTPAANVALPAFAAARRAAAPCCCGAGRAAIDRHLLPTGPGPQQQTRRTQLQRANETDRRTDTVPLHRPCSAYYAAVPIKQIKYCAA